MAGLALWDGLLTVPLLLTEGLPSPLNAPRVPGDLRSAEWDGQETVPQREEMADALFEAGCDDGTPGTCNGVGSIDFHREAESLEGAIRSAMANVQSAGYEVERVEIEADALPQSA